MDGELARKILALFKEMWPPKGKDLPSSEIYRRLIESGEQIPYFAMYEVFCYMKEHNVIDGYQTMNKEAYEMHGNFFITWINPDFL